MPDLTVSINGAPKRVLLGEKTTLAKAYADAAKVHADNAATERAGLQEDFADQVAALPAIAVESGALLWTDADGFKWPLSSTPPLMSYFAFIGDSIAQGYGNSLGDPSPATKAYEVGAGSTLIYPLADPVGGAIGGSMMPAWANQWTAQTGERVAIAELATGSSYLLPVTANNWSPTGALRAAAKDRMLADIAALKANPDQNFDPDKGSRVAVVIYLGTNDAVAVDGLTVTGAIFREKYNELFDYFKAEVPDLTDLFVYQIGDDRDAAPAGINDKFREIRDAIEDAVALEPLARIVSRAGRSQAFDAQNQQWDNVHYNRTANNLLGKLGAREAAKATATVPTAPTLLASTLYEDSDSAFTSARTVAHALHADTKAVLAIVSSMNTAGTSVRTINSALLGGTAMSPLGIEVNMAAASNAATPCRIDKKAFLLNADGIGGQTLDLAVALSGNVTNISLAVFEFGSPVAQESGFANRINGTTLSTLARSTFTANPAVLCAMVSSAATAAGVLTHTITGPTEVDEGGQVYAANGTVSQAAIATAEVAMNTEAPMSVTFSAAVQAAILYAVAVRRREDGE